MNAGQRLLTDPPPRLPVRDPKGHKGTFGTVMVVGGCASEPRMIGAPAFSALAALRAGCGLAKMLTPEPILNQAVSLCPSATGLPLVVDGDNRVIDHLASEKFDGLCEEVQAIVVGPGLGEGSGPARLALRAIQHEGCPVILDADALNRLAEIPELHRDWRCAGVITPHPGEFKRLAASLKLEADAVTPATRPSAAEELAQKLGCIVVLKGAATVVSDGHRTWVNSTGGPELATAGTGDVLSGIIASFAAQFVAMRVHPKIPISPAVLATKPLDLFDATRAAVMAHGLAGEAWRKGRGGATGGLIASELLEELPAVIEGMRSSK